MQRTGAQARRKPKMTRPGSARQLEDLYEEETIEERLNTAEGLGDALRGLISTSGIQASVVKFGTRMKAIEVRLGKMQQQIDQLFAESATKVEQQELVDTWICTDKLITSNEAMTELSNTVNTLATWATQDRRGRLDDILKWRRKVDDRQEKHRVELTNLRDQAEEHHKNTVARFEELRTFMDQSIHESVDRQPLIIEIRDRVQVLGDDLVKLESNLKDWASREIRDFVGGELTTIPQRSGMEATGLENAGSGCAVSAEAMPMLHPGLGVRGPRRRSKDRATARGGGGGEGAPGDDGTSDAGDSTCSSPRALQLPMSAGLPMPVRSRPGSSGTSGGTGSRPCSKQLDKREKVLSDLQVRLVNFVRDALVGGVRDELVLSLDGLKQVLFHTRTELQALTSKVDSVDRATRDVKVKLKSAFDELTNELKSRPNFDFFSSFQLKMDERFEKLQEHTFDSEQKVVYKLNDFVAHMEKVHDVIDSHEHCLRHHAEELANRSTKYQLLLLQAQVDACLGREEFDTEAKAIKKLITANTSKLDNMSMSSRMRRAPGKPKKPMSSHRKKRAGSALSATSSSLSMSRMPSRMDDDNSSGFGSESRNEGGNDGIIEEEPDHVDEQEAPAPGGLSSKNADSGASLPTTAGGLSTTASTGSFPKLAGDGAEAVEKAEEPPPSAGTFSLGDLSVPEGDAEMSGSEDGEEEDEEEYEEVSDWSQDQALPYMAFRQQLEGVSMGLFSLAYLVLRAPRRGGSLSVRLDREKELLEELENLRHWITHKMQPAGWDLSRLTTIALRCTHAPKEEASFPQVSSTVKQLMEIDTSSRTVAAVSSLSAVSTKPVTSAHKAVPLTPRNLPPIEGVRGAGL